MAVDTTYSRIVVAVNPDGSNISGGGGSLPAGASTSANQATEITALQAIQANTSPPATTKATYASSIVGLAQSSSGIAAQIGGSSSKLVRVTRVLVSGTLTAAGTMDVSVTRRTATSSGGSSTPGTTGSFDGLDASATALPLFYTAPPTASGVAAALAGAAKAVFAAPGALGNVVDLQFGTRGGKALVLRSTNDVAVVTVSSAASYAGSSVDITIEWTEE